MTIEQEVQQRLAEAEARIITKDHHANATASSQGTVLSVHGTGCEVKVVLDRAQVLDLIENLATSLVDSVHGSIGAIPRGENVRVYKHGEGGITLAKDQAVELIGDIARTLYVESSTLTICTGQTAHNDPC